MQGECSKGFGQPQLTGATMWRVWYPVSLTSFTAPNDATGSIFFSLTDEETDSERLMNLPKITQQAVGRVCICI